MKSVTVIDYGIGNLFSVQRALEKCGGTVNLADDAAGVHAAERLVLPGVGAFADGMSGLRQRNLCAAIQEFARSQRPLLGICLGMQMLLSYSEEFGEHEGLGIVPGRVVAIPTTAVDGSAHKIPNIGWSQLHAPEYARAWDSTILRSVAADSAVYLVHSFTAVPDAQEHRLADCYYGGRLIAATINAGNVYGCQFHPEKSGIVGLQILSAFLDLPA